MAVTARKKRFFATIDTREDALRVVRNSSIWVFVVAAIQALFGYEFAPALLFDAALLLVLGIIVWRWHSRTAAVLLLLLAMSGAVLAVRNGGQTLVLVIIMLIASARAVEATFMLHGRFAEPPTGGA